MSVPDEVFVKAPTEFFVNVSSREYYDNEVIPNVYWYQSRSKALGKQIVDAFNEHGLVFAEARNDGTCYSLYFDSEDNMLKFQMKCL